MEDIVIPAYTDTQLTVKGDSNLVPQNIRSGVSVLGVVGTLLQGATGMDYGFFKIGGNYVETLEFSHSLGEVPTHLFVIPNAKIWGAGGNTTYALLDYGYISNRFGSGPQVSSNVLSSIPATETKATVKCHLDVPWYSGEYIWIAIK